MYQSLRSETKSPHKTRRELEQASLVALLLNFLFAGAITILSIYIFGSDMKFSIVDSFDMEGKSVSSYVLRLAYLVIIIGHLPFIFFAGKESALIIFEEAKYGSLTSTIDRNIAKHENDRFSIGLDSCGSPFDKKYEQGSVLDKMDNTLI